LVSGLKATLVVPVRSVNLFSRPGFLEALGDGLAAATTGWWDGPAAWTGLDTNKKPRARAASS